MGSFSQKKYEKKLIGLAPGDYSKVRNDMGVHGEFLRACLGPDDDVWAMRIHVIYNEKKI